MDVVSITAKHQITIPSKVRRSMNLQKGDRLAFESAANGGYTLRKVPLKKSDGTALPYLPPGIKPLTTNDFKAAIEARALASLARRRN